ncbi:putative Translation initiation factor eIF-2B subunit family protein [Seiridium unicorne]|uniref:Translation initiation factor eIF-2B subunit family protein n=1 Tax=Seiridium unicorne TaxID=138068 RepID=A0ABR2ULF5_9PEZI
MATDNPVKKRTVAATFLFRISDDASKKAEVALFRRSSHVRTYQHRLAPISGSVEAGDINPLATALREIQEETTLDLASIELLRKGKPYSFADNDIGREWTIYPFAFRLKSIKEGGSGEAGISIDWEHDGWEWHDPLKVDDTDKFGGVPKLVNSLRRVWPVYDLGAEAGGALNDGLEDLGSDHKSGARQLAAKAISILRDVVSKLDSTQGDGEAWWSNVRMAAWHLSYNGRESMGAAIVSSLIAVLKRIEAVWKEAWSNDETLKQHVLATIDEFLAQRNSAVNRICNSFVNYVKSNVLEHTRPSGALSVLTTSYSSTIANSLLKAAEALDITLDLRVLESRPLCEGVTLASKLLLEANQNRRVNVTLFSDASAAIAARGVRFFLFGADRISSTGDVSNKIGTLPAILSTRHISPQAKAIAFSEVEKIAIPESIDDHPVEENDPAELMQAWEARVEGAPVIKEYILRTHGDAEQSRAVVKNVYFEWVPNTLISEYITDEGPWTVEDIRKKSQWVEEECHRFYGNL